MLKTPAGTRFCVNPTPWNVWCDRRWWCLWAYPKHLQTDGLSTFSYFGVKLLIAHQMYYYTRVIHARTPADRRFWHFFILWCAAIYWVPGVLWCTCDALKNTCRQTFWAVFFRNGVKRFTTCQMYCDTIVIHSRAPAGRRVVHVFIRWG